MMIRYCLMVDTFHSEINSFDYALAFEVIEHMKKQDGMKLLDEAERIARKKVNSFNSPAWSKVLVQRETPHFKMDSRRSA